MRQPTKRPEHRGNQPQQEPDIASRIKLFPKGKIKLPTRKTVRSRKIPNDGVPVARGFRLSSKELVSSGDDKLVEDALVEILGILERTKNIEEYLKYKYLYHSIGARNFNIYHYSSYYRINSHHDLLNIFDNDASLYAKSEHRQMRQMKRQLAIKSRKSPNSINMVLSSFCVDSEYGRYNTRALVSIPNHRLRRKNPPYSGEMYYFVADSPCLTLAIYTLIQKGVDHLSIRNMSVEQIEQVLWPQGKGKIEDMIETRMSRAESRRLEILLTVEQYEIEEVKQGLYILSAALGNFESDRQSYNITKFK